MTSTDQPMSFLERRQAAITEAALAEWTKRGEEMHRIENLVLGTNRRDGRSVDEVVKLGDDDFLVKVVDRDNKVQWTTVVGGKANIWYHERQEEAILHLIATRYDDNPNSTVNAVMYAGRVLGIPATQ